MLRRIILYLLLLLVVVTAHYLVMGVVARPVPKADLETPSPALGRVIATTVHQTVTDPYFAPLEKLASYLSENPDREEVSIDLLTKWAPDNRLPTCFVWNRRSGELQIDQSASPWVLETVLERVQEGLVKPNPHGLLYVNTFKVEGERFWLGFIKVPIQQPETRQMAGVFFSIDKYMSEYVPLLIDEFVNRQRFPLVPFQRDDPPIHGEQDGDISIRILDAEGRVYLQHGRTFEPEKMIYAESRWYPNPIVCLQEGWDLQVFSANAVPAEDGSGRQLKAGLILVAVLVLTTVFFWWGVKKG